MVKLIIGGDICPTNRDRDAFINGNSNKLFGDLFPHFKNADYIISNLETPLIKIETPIDKSGSVFSNPPQILNAIEKSGISFLNLANNHILDHGEVGLKTTIEALKLLSIDYSGAEENLLKAAKPFQKQIKNKKIAILSYTEHEFSIAKHNKSGANPIDIIDFVNKIKKLKEDNDFILLLYHGGKENYRLPTPKQQKLCRFFIEQGVNFVICQHSHVGGAFENYEDGHIFYGQGNFIFDAYPLKKDWLYKGFLIEINISDDNLFNYQLIPFIHNSYDDNGIGIRKMNEVEAKNYLNVIEKESIKMKTNTDYVNQSWEELALSLKDIYFSILNGNGRFIRKINQKLPWLRYVYSKKRKLVLKNIINCETHREIVETILKQK